MNENGKIKFVYAGHNSVESRNNHIKIHGDEVDEKTKVKQLTKDGAQITLDKVVTKYIVNVIFKDNDGKSHHHTFDGKTVKGFGTNKFLNNMQYDRLDHVHKLSSDNWQMTIRDRNGEVTFSKY